MTEDHNGWDEWQRHVLSELKRLNGCWEQQTEKTTQLLVGITELKAQFKIKSGIWGALGGMVPILVAFVIFLITGVI